jgi:hypothetical protein
MKDNNVVIPDNFQKIFLVSFLLRPKYVDVALKFAPLLRKTKTSHPRPPLISNENDIETKANVSFDNGILLDFIKLTI